MLFVSSGQLPPFSRSHMGTAKLGFSTAGYGHAQPVLESPAHANAHAPGKWPPPSTPLPFALTTARRLRIAESGPCCWIDGKRCRPGIFEIHENTVIGDLAVAEQLPQQIQGIQRYPAIDEQRLLVEGIGQRAGRRVIFGLLRLIDDLREKIAGMRQPVRIGLGPTRRHNAENDLTIMQAVAQIEPIPAASPSHRLQDCFARQTIVHTTNR